MQCHLPTQETGKAEGLEKKTRNSSLYMWSGGSLFDVQKEIPSWWLKVIAFGVQERNPVKNIKLGVFSLWIVFKALRLVGFIQEVKIESKKRYKDWAWGHSNIKRSWRKGGKQQRKRRSSQEKKKIKGVWHQKSQVKKSFQGETSNYAEDWEWDSAEWRSLVALMGNFSRVVGLKFNLEYIQERMKEFLKQQAWWLFWRVFV